jgi:hypothetical protein
VIPFSGALKGEYRPWKIKTSAIGNKYEWMKALQSDLTHPGLSGAALTDPIRADQKLNGKAVTYLVLACTDKAFNTVTNSKVYQNAFEMWESLRMKLEADNDDNLVGLVGEFVSSRLENNKEDPEEWISRLEIMSQEMAALDAKYEKSDQEIMAHTFAHLPKVYESTIDALQNNGKKNTLEELKKGLTTKWKALYGKNNKGKSTKTEDGVEEALHVETKKNNFKKKFKGDCRTCGKQGHKSVDCWKGKGKSMVTEGQPFPKETIALENAIGATKWVIYCGQLS